MRRFGMVPEAAHVEARLHAAPAALIALNADIVALQEVFEARHRDFLAAAMRPVYPEHASGGHGLMLLSRHPIVEARVIGRADGGFLATAIEAPKIGRVSLVNVHLRPELPIPLIGRAVSAARRRAAVGDLMRAAGASGAAVLAGDFNAGPESAPANYRRLLAAGYVDALAATHDPARLRAAATWDPANPLNAATPYRRAPRQRIDHVLVSAGAVRDLMPRAARIVLTAPVVPVLGVGMVTLSDHFGVLVQLGGAGTASPGCPMC
ncbi:MAG: endonuclease/exonuclease/phosphatase family protein [Alphaproteobacteria bacterium]|nr:endonuclease/exonuclease/phosphatase family protein [Alphaproteobacteria bacterium]